jgi:hypothetical protein
MDREPGWMNLQASFGEERDPGRASGLKVLSVVANTGGSGAVLCSIPCSVDIARTRRAG